MSDRPPPLDDATVLIEGPWTHRTVSANGIGLHVAELGEGPLVLFLHGFPQFWWTWRRQLTDLADGGYRAVAVDLRGYGASDKPPRGYDLMTLAEDVAGLVAALGEDDALVVGSDIGGLLAWSVATFAPAVVRGIVVLGAPHPLRVRRRIATDPAGQGRALARELATFQVPRWPEHLLKQPDYIAQLFTAWSGQTWRDGPEFDDSVARYAAGMQVSQVAHSSLEMFRWLVRSLPRSDGRRAAAKLRVGVGTPVLQLHGADDPYLLPGTAQGSERYVRAADHELHALPGVGHYPQDEAPDEVSRQILRWADQTRT